MIVPVASARAVAPAVTILGRQLSAEKAVAVFSVFIAAVGAALFGFVGLLIGGGVGFAAGCLAAYFRKEAPPVANIASSPSAAIGEGILPFLDGGIDLKGRTYDGILLWDDRRLESEHDWVQQVFPTRNRSAHHPDPDRWILTNEIMGAIRTSPVRQNKIRQAYFRVLQFFQLDRPLTALPIWVTPANHNFLRISRIISSLRSAGLETEAQDLMQRLCVLGDLSGARPVIGGSFRFWERAG